MATTHVLSLVLSLSLSEAAPQGPEAGELHAGRKWPPQARTHGQ
jgi:hypothetical protein